MKYLGKGLIIELCFAPINQPTSLHEEMLGCPPMKEHLWLVFTARVRSSLGSLAFVLSFFSILASRRSKEGSSAISLIFGLLVLSIVAINFHVRNSLTKTRRLAQESGIFIFDLYFHFGVNFT